MFSSNGNSANATLRFNSDCQPSVLKKIRSEHKSLNKDIDNLIKYSKTNIEIKFRRYENTSRKKISPIHRRPH